MFIVEWGKLILLEKGIRITFHDLSIIIDLCKITPTGHEIIPKVDKYDLLADCKSYYMTIKIDNYNKSIIDVFLRFVFVFHFLFYFI